MNQASVNSVWVDRLDIRQFAGVSPDSAFTLKDLSPGINIIYGPNGCGKSTTARAIQALLWPKPSTEYRDIAAIVRRNAESWQLSCRGREVQSFVNGHAGPLPQWTSAETRNRYHWSLQNLLRDHDEDLARQIAREMAGGIDFQKLAADLNWQKKPAAPSRLHQNYQAAEKKIRETRERQQGLLQEARQLKDLVEQQQHAARAAADIPRLLQVRELHEKSQALQTLQQKLVDFPPGMQDLRSDDADVLSRLRADEVRLTESLQELQGQREALGEGETQWALFGNRDFTETRKELDGQLSQLRDLNHDLKAAEKTLSNLEAKEQSMRSNLGIHRQAALDFNQGFDFPDLHAWINLVIRQLETQERRAILKEALQTEQPPEDQVDVETLREARLNLESWLKSQPPGSPLPQLPFILCLLILGGLLIYLGATGKMSWFWTLLLLPAPLLQITLQRRQKDRWITELETRHPAAVPQPTVWTPEAVQQNLSQLDQAIRDQHAFDLLQTDRRRLQTVENALAEIDAAIEKHQAQLQGVGLDALPQSEWLAHFLESVQTWRQLRTELAAAEANKARLEAQRELLHVSLGNQLQKWGQVTQGMSWEGATDSLTERMQRETERRQQRKQLELTRTHHQQQLQERHQAILDLCARVGLSEGDVATLKQRLARKAEWTDTLRHSETLQARLSELRKALEDHPDLCGRQADEIDQNLLQAEAARERDLALRDQISKLEQRIEDQRRGRNVHEAEEALGECREALRAEREQQLETRLGMEILSWLQTQCRSRDRSRVLEEANRNLVRFSQTTLQLHLSLNEGDDEFTASRPGKAALPLRKLSAGERSQVLMAVRLAFLQLNENAALPLLVDEALGTTDDERGEQVIRALIEVSRQGRQIFYFTAQQDELDKWRHVLQNEDESAVMVDLAALRAGARMPAAPALIPKQRDPQDFRQQPEESLTDWARRLQVAHWHPRQKVEALPLWHLIYDQPDLLQMLFAQQITSVGQWMIYDQSGALDSRVDAAVRAAVNRQIEVLQVLQENWQIGRPPLLSAKDLVESGIVSDRFSADLCQLLETLNGDAAQLIDALDQKAVSGFMQKKTRELESWLKEQGFLVDTSALSADEILARVMARFADRQNTPIPTPIPWERLNRLMFQSQTS